VIKLSNAKWEDKTLMEENEPIFEKETLAERMMRDKAARERRRERKLLAEIHTYKEEKEARERRRAKRILVKQKRRTRRMENINA